MRIFRRLAFLRRSLDGEVAAAVKHDDRPTRSG
jgi:hypothetical protein